MGKVIKNGIMSVIKTDVEGVCCGDQSSVRLVWDGVCRRDVQTRL